MCACAKQYGNIGLTYFKMLWSWERVIVENQELISVLGKTCKKGKAKSKNEPTTVSRGETPETTRDDVVTPPSSPRTDPSPSPIPQLYKCTTAKFQFYRLLFAGRKLPILFINCYTPTSTNKKICGYGGCDENGEKVFLIVLGV